MNVNIYVVLGHHVCFTYVYTSVHLDIQVAFALIIFVAIARSIVFKLLVICFLLPQFWPWQKAIDYLTTYICNVHLANQYHKNPILNLQ